MTVPPRNADSTRGSHFHRLLAGRPAVYAIVLGGVGAFVAGAALGSVPVMVGAPLAVIALVVLVAFVLADRRAEEDFFVAFADGHGFAYALREELMPLTPLLGAGERRHCEHWMQGRLGGRAEGVPCGVGHYTYETRETDHDSDGPGHDHWEQHHFTICVVDLEPGMTLYPGLFLEKRRGIVALLGSERWVSRHGKRKVELESAQFTDRYELLVDRAQDDVRLRELFSPSLILWLARHPLAPCFEYGAGTLVVYLDRRLDDAGNLNWMLEAAAEITARFADQISQEAGRRAA
jgi:hypothetical protein